MENKRNTCMDFKAPDIGCGLVYIPKATEPLTPELFHENMEQPIKPCSNQTIDSFQRQKKAMVDYKNINVITGYDENILLNSSLLDELGFHKDDQDDFIWYFENTYFCIVKAKKDNNHNDWIEKGTHEDPYAKIQYEYDFQANFNHVCTIENLKQLKCLYYVLNS